MAKFDMLNAKNGDIFKTVNGEKYLFINSISYNFATGDYIVHDRDGGYPKAKENKKDLAFVYRMPSCPDANKLSEALKLFKGASSKYTLDTVWQAEDPAVTAAKKRLADIDASRVAAEAALASAIRNAR